MLAQEQILKITPALKRGERGYILKEYILPFECARLRQHFQCLCRPSDFIQPPSQGDKSFVGQIPAALVSLLQTRSISEMLDCIGHVLIRQSWIQPNANFERQ